MSLSTKDYKALLGIIDSLYGAPDRAALFQALWEQLDRLIGISSAIFFPIDSQTHHFLFNDHVRYQGPIKPAFLYTVYYAPMNPLTEARFLKQDTPILKITDAVSARWLTDSEYGCDFMPLTPHFYELVAPTYFQGELLGGLALHRQRHDRDFTDRHRDMLSLLLPHFSRALHHLDLMEALHSSQTAGVIVLGVDGRILMVNNEAKRALNGKSLEAIPIPGLGEVPVMFQAEAGTYRIRTAPVRYGRKEQLVILDPQPGDREMQTRLSTFGLSRREQEVTLWVIRGRSNREIADRLCIAEETVKDHLKAVFDKMAIRRRSEIAAKLLWPSSENGEGEEQNRTP